MVDDGPDSMLRLPTLACVVCVPLAMVFEKKKLERARGHVGRWHSGAYGRGSVDGKCEQLLAAGAAADRPQRAPDPMLEYESSRAG